MRAMRATLAPLLFLLAACHACGAQGDGPETESADPRPEPPARASCLPPELASAGALPPARLPEGCRFSAGGSAAAPRKIASALELADVVSCDPGVAPAIDLDHRDLYVIEFSMSPAFGGSESFDDGTRVTFLTRFRQPCPDDPQPMPMQAYAAFQLPKDAQRTFAEAVCTLEASCD
jgi:hypothetical protein